MKNTQALENTSGTKGTKDEKQATENRHTEPKQHYDFSKTMIPERTDITDS